MKPFAACLLTLCLIVLAACAGPTQVPPATPSADAPSPTAATPAATSDAPTATPRSAPTAAASATRAVASATPAPPTLQPTSTANPTIAGGLIGLWQGNNNSYYLLNTDGTWNWDTDGQKVLTAPENQGRWWLEGDIFRIQDTAGMAPCPLDQVGSYQAVLTGDVLTLTAVADLCTVRIDQTAGNYARQAVGP